ncbi:tyrosine-type recombinase/integrase [Duganella sp. FT50W]|uniref:Tyrosine-type recombinase/integrase n=2 Tax=Duganella lactea TaxID=2692173 RepID=A0A6L8MNM1_9BURK|nr:tyrosine-type recombinase/integrase [Duganella lactea]
MFFCAEIVLFLNNTDCPDLKHGAPALFLETNDKLILFEEPTQFLSERYVSCGSTSSPHTWAKAAYCLKSWFQFLQAIEREWPNASEQDRADFRDAYLGSISQKTGMPFGTAGVRDTMAVVRSFYQHCANRGTYHGDLRIADPITSAQNVPISRDATASSWDVDVFKIKDRALPKVRPGVKIHPLPARDLKNLLYQMGPQAGARDGDQRMARDRLICDLGWVVGLRLNEINSLTTLQFMTLVPDPYTPFVGMALTVLGKGNKTRQVMIPTWLVIDVQAYMDGERAASIRACVTKTRSPPTRLLLGHEHSGKAGKPITNAALQKIFRNACLDLGLVSIVEKTDPETGRKFTYKRPRHSIHDLRHTYAVLTYHAERANGNAEPWKKIQAQLGHSKLQTTIDIYLSHVEIFADQPGLLDTRRLLGL